MPQMSSSRMNVARLAFYAIASFFMGCVTQVFNPPFGGEPVKQLLLALTFGAPLFFLVLAGYEIVRPTDRR
jgi:hypothetical protein